LKIVGLISDTHIPSKAKAIPPKVFEVFHDAMFIIHAGDLTQLSVINDLERLAPVVAASGNMDEPTVQEKLPKMNMIDVGKWKIGVIHTLGAFNNLQKMKKAAKQNNFQVLVFGHTHRPFIKQEANTWFINPGSPTNPIPSFVVKPTVGLLKISGDKIEPEIIQI
jgi:putative phosphoesterase